MKQSAGILDNKSRGNVVSELGGNIAVGCTLSVVSALFSLYAYDELNKELAKVSKFRLLVPGHGEGENFLKNLPGNHLDRHLRNRLDVTRIARECSDWLEQKCEIRELPSSVHQNLIHLSHAGSDEYLSSSFTTFERSDDIKLYGKLPDWIVLIEVVGKEKLYFVVETKGMIFMEERRPKENANTKCGIAHFKVLGNDVQFTDTNSFEEFTGKYV